MAIKSLDVLRPIRLLSALTLGAAVALAQPAPAADTTTTATGMEMRSMLEAVGENGIIWYQHVQTLANEYFEGRVNGSAGTERARDYLEFYFKLYDLQPAFPTDDSGGAWVSHRQPFEFSPGRQMTATIEKAQAKIGDAALVNETDFVVLGNSGTGDVAAPITFVGYGIEQGPDGYSSFDDDTDLTGRIALLLRYEPLNNEGLSRWADERFSDQSSISRKMRALRDRNAAGIILVNPPDCKDGRSGLESLDRSQQFGRSVRIPAIQVTPEKAGELLAAADPQHRDLMTWRKLADYGEVTTVNLNDNVTVSIGAAVEWSRGGTVIAGENVGAVLPGKGSLKDEYLVIGGHYDHNGYGDFTFSSDRHAGPLYPGADDNASGTAGVLVLAKMLSEAYDRTDDNANLRSVLFICFDAEERGLIGSRHYSDNPTLKPEQMIALLNMDMIGRVQNNRLDVLGTGTAEGLPGILDPHFKACGLDVHQEEAGSGRSDDANFARLNVPAMHFFTGMHAEYTTPADKAYTVNPVGAAQVLDLMYDVAMDLVARPEKLAFKSPARGAGENRQYAGVRLGIRPGMGENIERGVLVETVSADTAAEAAGMKDGDIIIRWGGDDVLDIAAMMEKLQSHKPGDKTKIVVLRDGAEVELDVEFKASEE